MPICAPKITIYRFQANNKFIYMEQAQAHNIPSAEGKTRNQNHNMRHIFFFLVQEKWSHRHSQLRQKLIHILAQYYAK